MKANGEGYSRTSRETYSRIIGYDFGGWIYNGGYWLEDGTKQYEFLKYDGNKLTSQYLTDYKGFREIIDAYDWPKRDTKKPRINAD